MDIFGRNIEDYAILRDLQEAGRLQGYLNQRALEATQYGHQPHDFQSLDRLQAGGIQQRAGDPYGIGYVTDNLQAVQTVIDNIMYTSGRLTEFLPVLMDGVDEGAVSYGSRIIDRFGRGRAIDNEGSNVERAQSNMNFVPLPLQLGGLDGVWTREDVRRAMLGGHPLSTETIEATIEGCLDHIEEVAFEGDVESGPSFATGLKNQDADASPDENEVQLTTETDKFSARAGDTIIDDLNTQIAGIIDDTKQTLPRNLMDAELCVYMPNIQASIVSTKRLTQGNDLSIWKFFEMNNAWSSFTKQRGPEMQPKLKWLQELNGAGGSSADRVIVAVKHPRVMEIAVPIMPRIISVQDKGRVICAEGEYKYGPLHVKHPRGIRYIDYAAE